jgi:hypothetical protein
MVPDVREEPDVRIQDYLDRVLAPLAESVPYHERQELRTELRDHLGLLIDAYAELGDEDPIAAALRQFGEAKTLGRSWLRRWEREQVTSPLPAMRTALAFFVPAALLGWFSVRVLNGMSMSPQTAYLLAFPLVALLPLFTGFLAGLFSRGRQALGTFLAVSTLAAANLLLALLLQAQLPPDGLRETPELGFAIVQTLFWIPLGTVGAAAGGSLRRWLRESVRRWAPG